MFWIIITHSFHVIQKFCQLSKISTDARQHLYMAHYIILIPCSFKYYCNFCLLHSDIYALIHNVIKQQISDKARKSRSFNEHPHYLGQAGYAGVKAKWIIEGHNSSTTVSGSSILDRSKDWILARSKQGADGNYTIPNEKTQIVADKVVWLVFMYYISLLVLHCYVHDYSFCMKFDTHTRLPV